LLGFLISFSSHIICFIIRALWFTTFFIFFTHFTVTSKNCCRRSQPVVGTSLSLYKMSLSLLSEISECVLAYNLHRILSSFRTL
jgi:hypothetical protein